MTLLSFIAFLTVADLGIGGSLVTAISRALGAGETGRIRQLQANGFLAASVTAVVLVVLVALLVAADVGAFMFPSSSASMRDEANRAFAVFGVLFAATLPLTLITKIQLGLQRGHVSNYWQIASALLNFSMGVLAARAGWGVASIVAALMSGTLLCGIANLVVHWRRHPDMRPQRDDLSIVAIRDLLKDSFSISDFKSSS